MEYGKQIEIKRAVVTGGAGFIGSHLVDELINLGVETKVIDNLSTGRIENVNKNAPFVKVDIRDYDALRSEFKDTDVVFHLAACPRIIPSIKDPQKYHDINVTGTLNVLKVSLENGVRNFVYAASSSCYGNPSEIPTPETAIIETRCNSSCYSVGKLALSRRLD